VASHGVWVLDQSVQRKLTRVITYVFVPQETDVQELKGRAVSEAIGSFWVLQFDEIEKIKISSFGHSRESRACT